MKVKLIHDPKEFLKISSSQLSQNEAENSLMLSLADRLIPNSALFGDTPNFFIIKDDDVQSFAMQTPPYNLILSYPFESSHIEPLINFIRKSNIRIPGIIAENQLAESFSNKWKVLDNTETNIVMNERIYCLSEVNRECLVSKNNRTFQLANQENLDLILGCMYEFNIEASPESDFPDKIEFVHKQRTAIVDAINDGQFHILKENGTVVCMARTPGKTINGRLVNYVYTPKQFRKNGHGTNCVAHLSEKILSSGFKYCMLFTDLSNPTSNRIYQKIGYKPVLDVNLIRFS